MSGYSFVERGERGVLTHRFDKHRGVNTPRSPGW